MFKVVPDETMRGLELRKGSVDLVVNDLSPDLVHGLAQGRPAVGRDRRRHRLRLRRASTFAIRCCRDRRVRQAMSYAIDTRAIIEHLRRGLARPSTGVVPSMSWAYEPNVQQYPRDLTKAKALLDEAGFPDPDGPGPLPRLRLTLKTSTAEPYRVQAAVIQQNLAEAGIALEIRSYEFATLMADVIRGNVQLYTLAVRGRHRSGHAAAGVSFVAGAAGRIQSRSLRQPRSGSAHRRRRRPRSTSASADGCTGEAQRLIAADAPYVSLWAAYERGGRAADARRASRSRPRRSSHS